MLAQLISKTSEIKSRPSAIANSILLAAICILVMKLLFQLFSLNDKSYSYEDITVEAQALRERELSHEQEERLASLHLFGSPSSNEITTNNEPGIDSATAPESPLNLTLKGVAAERIRLNSRAIILNNSTNQEEFFAVRDTVFDLATIDNIYHDRVVLVRKGKYEILRLAKESLQKSHVQMGRMDDAYKIGITNFLNKTIIQKDPALTYPVTLNPIYRKAQLIGYTITIQQQDRNGIIQGMGLENGDLITAFNGTSFADIQSAKFSSAMIRDMTSAEIEILRDNDIHTFRLETDNYQEAAYQDGIEEDDGLINQ